MALQRTRRPRIRSGRSLCSLGSPLNARSFGAVLFQRPSWVLTLGLACTVLFSCSTQTTSRTSVLAKKASRRPEPIQFSYRPGFTVSEKPSFWSLQLDRGGKARMDARMEGLPEGTFVGEVRTELSAAIAVEVDRLARSPESPICGGHSPTFEVVDLPTTLYRNDCLPLRPGSLLTTLYRLVEEALKATKWTPFQDREPRLFFTVENLKRNSDTLLGHPMILRGGFVDRGSEGLVVSDALTSATAQLPAELGTAQGAERARKLLPDLFATPRPEFVRLKPLCILGVLRSGTGGNVMLEIQDVAPYDATKPCFPVRSGK